MERPVRERSELCPLSPKPGRNPSALQLGTGRASWCLHALEYFWALRRAWTIAHTSRVNSETSCWVREPRVGGSYCRVPFIWRSAQGRTLGMSRDPWFQGWGWERAWSQRGPLKRVWRDGAVPYPVGGMVTRISTWVKTRTSLHTRKPILLHFNLRIKF